MKQIIFTLLALSFFACSKKHNHLPLKKEKVLGVFYRSDTTHSISTDWLVELSGESMKVDPKDSAKNIFYTDTSYWFAYFDSTIKLKTIKGKDSFGVSAKQIKNEWVKAIMRLKNLRE